MDIIRLSKENEFFYDLRNYIIDPQSDILNYDEKEHIWKYLRRDRSGRDFFTSIPIDYITEDEKNHLEEYLIEEFGIEDYDWNDIDIEEVKELLYENDFLYNMFDDIQKL